MVQYDSDKLAVGRKLPNRICGLRAVYEFRENEIVAKVPRAL